MNYIELFAGCGGLSLGLKSVGFDLLMANELSPMAAETYAFNFFNENLRAKSEFEQPQLTNTLWLSSQYALTDLKLRLTEDPRSYPALESGYSDMLTDGSNIKGKLIVGSISDLNIWLEDKPLLAAALSKGLGNGDVDLVSGGPPCQSFSMAGLRKQDCHKNTLPWEFAKFVKTVKPKLVLLENVTGILRPFRDELGNRYYAWFEIAKAFSGIGYVPLCLHINAKFSGVPQNRPRFILIGVRKDFLDKIAPTFNESEMTLFCQPLDFYERTKNGEEIELNSLNYRDISREKDFLLFKNSFLKPLVVYPDKFVTVTEAIDDLRDNCGSKTTYSKNLTRIFGKIIKSRELKNHEHRRNGPVVKRRFNLYQNLLKVNKETQKKVLGILKGVPNEISDEEWKALSGFRYLTESGERVLFKKKEDFMAFLKLHPTKKQTQKALIADQPAPAALSIPDDACHYHPDELRTLTVREVARIQSFPDSFEFRSKITTGGQLRRFEVPQYTQVGNAVPPLLGRALGVVLSSLLERATVTSKKAKS